MLSLALLNEACEFYADDRPTRLVLVGVLERLGKNDEANHHREYLLQMDMRASEPVCRQHADAAFRSANFVRAAQLFDRGVQFHPHSLLLHQGLEASLRQTGDVGRADAEQAIIAHMLQQQQQRAMMQQQAGNARANGWETAGTVAGAGIGVTGAAVGGGITIVSLLFGVLIALAGVALCIVAVLLFLTCIGFPLAILAMGAGFALISAGFAVMVGGAAAGAGAGLMGIFAGALTSGTAMLHHVSRRGKN